MRVSWAIGNYKARSEHKLDKCNIACIHEIGFASALSPKAVSKPFDVLLVLTTLS
jgi:hypothetical protein